VVSFRAVCRFEGPLSRCAEHFTDADLFAAHRWRVHRVRVYRYVNTTWDRPPTTHRILTDVGGCKPSRLLGHLDLLALDAIEDLTAAGTVLGVGDTL
jgi:hypothetical protein